MLRKILSLFCVTVALLPTISLSDRGCPGGWIHYGNKCYHFSNDDESVSVAVLMCQHLGGVLTEVEGSAKNDFLTKQANMTKRNYWIALNDIQEEGIWRWCNSNTELMSSAVVDWAPDQPDNQNAQQNCAFIRAAGHWADGPYLTISYIDETIKV